MLFTIDNEHSNRGINRDIERKGIEEEVIHINIIGLLTG
jgi:hypothetical protein